MIDIRFIFDDRDSGERIMYWQQLLWQYTDCLFNGRRIHKKSNDSIKMLCLQHSSLSVERIMLSRIYRMLELEILCCHCVLCFFCLMRKVNFTLLIFLTLGKRRKLININEKTYILEKIRVIFLSLLCTLGTC